MPTPVTAEEFAAADGVADWRYVLGRLAATFRAGSFTAAADLVARIAAAADAADHHPDVDVRYPDLVHVALRTHAAGDVTDLDVSMARTVSALAADAGCTSEPSRASVTEIAIDAVDVDAVRPFWRAVLGYRDGPGGTLVDPARIGPPVWFQQMDGPRPQRNRIHLDVDVPHDVADGAGRRRARGRRDDGDRRVRPLVVGARRRRGQRGVHLHLAGPRRELSPRQGVRESRPPAIGSTPRRRRRRAASALRGSGRRRAPSPLSSPSSRR